MLLGKICGCHFKNAALFAVRTLRSDGASDRNKSCRRTLVAAVRDDWSEAPRPSPVRKGLWDVTENRSMLPSTAPDERQLGQRKSPLFY